MRYSRAQIQRFKYTLNMCFGGCWLALTWWMLHSLSSVHSIKRWSYWWCNQKRLFFMHENFHLLSSLSITQCLNLLLWFMIKSIFSFIVLNFEFWLNKCVIQLFEQKSQLQNVIFLPLSFVSFSDSKFYAQIYRKQSQLPRHRQYQQILP